MIDIEQMPDRLRISHFGKDGTIQFKDIAIPRSEKFKWDLAGTERSDPNFLSWDGKPVKKTFSMFLGKYRIEEFLSSLPTEVTSEIYEFNQPEVWFCDIEVEVGEAFPDPAIAATPILTIALVDAKRNKVYVLGTKPLESSEVPRLRNKINDYFKNFHIEMDFEYIYFKSEAEMMSSFMELWVKKIPLLTGWNFIGFDWKYIINRCKRIGIDPAKSSYNGTMKGEDEIPQHKIIVDYLDLYKKWDRVVKIKENNKLDTVAHQVLGLNKIKYSGTFMDLYTTDYPTYVYYNAVDTVLVYLIDKKIKTMQTFLMLANITRVEALKAFSPIWMTEIVMAREFYKQKRVVAEIKKGTKNQSFEGAYVKHPMVGLHQFIATFDFASLYPSTMRQWNISPEMYKGKNIDLKEGWVKTASGAVFDNSQDSVMRTLLTKFFNKRKESKGKAFEIEKEIDYLEKLLIQK